MSEPFEICDLTRADERQGEFIRTEAELWHCGDDVCDCSQIVVDRIYRNRLSSLNGAVWKVRIAEGPFYTNGEHPAAEAEAHLAIAQRIATEDTASRGTLIRDALETLASPPLEAPVSPAIPEEIARALKEWDEVLGRWGRGIAPAAELERTADKLASVVRDYFTRNAGGAR